jgi:hypothetical protein
MAIPIPDLSDWDVFNFWAFVQKSDGCWNWLGAGGIGSSDRPKFTINGKQYQTSRIIWKIVNGSDPGELHVLHKCNNGKCVNPDHLYLGTDRDNIVDWYNDNPGSHRNKMTKGSNHPNSKLTESDIRTIRENSHNRTHKQLAKEFDICRSTVSYIIKGRLWPHVK